MLEGTAAPGGLRRQNQSSEFFTCGKFPPQLYSPLATFLHSELWPTASE